MNEDAIKKRIARAKTSAMTVLRKSGYDIIPSDNALVCILATRPTEIRFIRVVVDQVMPNDHSIVSKLRVPADVRVSREIWCCKRGLEFEITYF
jgi:hypothetical protein